MRPDPGPPPPSPRRPTLVVFDDGPRCTYDYRRKFKPTHNLMNFNGPRVSEHAICGGGLRIVWKWDDEW
jgi:hypothetical protein